MAQHPLTVTPSSWEICEEQTRSKVWEPVFYNLPTHGPLGPASAATLVPKSSRRHPEGAPQMGRGCSALLHLGSQALQWASAQEQSDNMSFSYPDRGHCCSMPP